MSAPEILKSSSAKSKQKDKERDKDKERERQKDNKQKVSPKAQTDRLKVVARRLPPNLPEEVFWKSVEQWTSDDRVVWKAFYGGKAKKRCVAQLVVWSPSFHSRPQSQQGEHIVASVSRVQG